MSKVDPDPICTGSAVQPASPGAAHGVPAPVPIWRVAGSSQTVALQIDGIRSVAAEAVTAIISRFILGIRISRQSLLSAVPEATSLHSSDCRLETKRAMARTQEFTVASGHVAPDDPRSTVDWQRLGANAGTVVLMMAVANLRAIASALISYGRPPTTPAVVIENASLPQQRIVRATLADIADAAASNGIEPPAVAVIGAVAGRSS